MEGEVALSVVAQIALALAGFTGVVSVLYSPASERKVNNLKATELIFEHTFVVALLGLLPFALHYSIPAGPNHYHTLWRIASCVFALAAAVLVSVQAYRIKTLALRGVHPRRPHAFTFGYFPIVAALIVAQVINAVIVASLPPYLWATLVLLFAPGLQFLYLVQSALDGVRLNDRCNRKTTSRPFRRRTARSIE
jgi:hypothetical protein